MVELPQTAQASRVGGGGGILVVPPPSRADDAEESKVASTMKYLEAVFFTRWSNPKAMTKAVTMN